MLFYFYVYSTHTQKCIFDTSEIVWHFDTEYRIYVKCFTMVNLALLKQLLPIKKPMSFADDLSRNFRVVRDKII